MPYRWPPCTRGSSGQVFRGRTLAIYCSTVVEAVQGLADMASHLASATLHSALCSLAAVRGHRRPSTGRCDWWRLPLNCAGATATRASAVQEPKSDRRGRYCRCGGTVPADPSDRDPAGLKDPHPLCATGQRMAKGLDCRDGGTIGRKPCGSVIALNGPIARRCSVAASSEPESFARCPAQERLRPDWRPS